MGRLRAHGVGPGVRCGVCLEQGPDMVVALLAVLATGGRHRRAPPTRAPVTLLRRADTRTLGPDDGWSTALADPSTCSSPPATTRP